MYAADTLNLSLRQRKILHILQNKKTYITSMELAKQLNVSSRTIRSDILFINESLTPFHAQILSERSKGYLLSVENSDILKKAGALDAAFSTREDRMRYLAFQLCLADFPINMYDLEDELYVSHATLENDLHLLKTKYVLSAPHIEFRQTKDGISFEPSERKKRMILNKLFHEDWDYHTKGNAYYGYDFLDPDILDMVMQETALQLERNSIRMEDTNLTSLNLAIAVAYHRIQSGHLLAPAPSVPKADSAAFHTVDALMNTLEKKLACTFSKEDRDEIYQIIASGHLFDASKLNVKTASRFFDPVTIKMAEAYLTLIHRHFLLDFSDDEDFYITLLQFLWYIQTPVCLFNMQENMDIAITNLFAEYEIANLFQDIAIEYLGYYIGQPELLYLSYCISGALEYRFHNHPEYKLNTVICSQLNLTAVWAIKRKILCAFDNYLTITSLLPVNTKSTYDFSHTDLIVTTVNKKITDNPSIDTIQISPFVEFSDQRKLESYIKRKCFQSLCRIAEPTLSQLISDAYWHTGQKPAQPFTIIESIAQDFIQDGIADSSFLEHILRRESISSFAYDNTGIVFLHSHQPCAKTKLSILSFQHSINWKSHKIWIAIMAAFRLEHMTLLFRLEDCFHINNYFADKQLPLKTKEEFISLFHLSCQ